MQWSYTRKYQVKAIFDDFPETVFLFRRIGDYYFLFSSRGGEYGPLPERRHYAVMEELVNGELGTIEHYRNRRSVRNLGVS
ncbi:hypothetical protein [Bhargavaea cecembensis]|uniref:hypothetical protein n=1 Tax=Bhargavaea cecembensis TaxID=394098 RepID=UPI00211D5682|nr:hypothetical protein [Bhargavaea cecembensis]